MKEFIALYTIIFIILTIYLYKKKKGHILIFSDEKLDKNQEIKVNYSMTACLALNSLIGILYIIRDASYFGDHYFQYYIGTIFFTIVMFIVINFLIVKKQI